MPAEGATLESSLTREFSTLQERRRPWEPAWTKVTDLIYPRRSAWSLEPNTKILVGEKIFDGTAINALNLMSDGVQGKLVTSSMPFFKLRFKAKELEEVEGSMAWLEQVELAMYGILSSSNFYDAMAEIFPDGIAIGTGYLYVEPVEGEGIVFSPRHFREMYVSENRFGRVDTFFRLFSMTLRQAVEEFGDDLPEETRKSAVKNPENTIQILHAVKPRKGWQPSEDGKELPAKSKRYGSYYLLYSGTQKAGRERNGKLIRESGFDVFPLVVWRFRKNPGEFYGRGPGLDAIYDVEMLNIAVKGLQEAGHRSLLPPRIVSEGLRGRIRTNPGGFTYWDGHGDPIVKDLAPTGQYPLTLEVVNRMEKLVREHFHADFFTILSMQRDQLMNQGPKGPKTATEIDAITAETASVLGTIVSRCETELLSPALALAYVFAQQLGLIPEPPKELAEGYPDYELEPEFVGPLAMAQRRFLTYQSTFEAGMALIQLAAAKGDTMPLLNFDWDGVFRNAAEAKGLQAKNILPPTKVLELKKQVLDQQQKMLELQIQLEQLKSPNMAKAPEPGSPLAESA